MSTAPTRREATHERIVGAASRAVRRLGYAGVGVADVMKEAGLTHGGFYAHFESRDAMLAEAVERAGRDSASAIDGRIAARQARGGSALRALVELYLSDAHLAGTEFGCVVAALASDMPRQSPALAEASAVRVRGLIALVQRVLPRTTSAAPAPGRAKSKTSAQPAAMAIAGTLVGSLQLARALGPNAQGRAVLAAAREALLAQYDLR